MLLRFILLILIPLPALPASSWENEVINLTIHARFQDADSLLNAQKKEYPLKAAFYTASMLNSRMTHYEDSSGARRFLTVLDDVITWSNDSLERAGLSVANEARFYFYMGSAYGFRAYFGGKNGQWVAALRDGALARRYLNKAIEKDSTLYDAYLGIGTYKYWLSTKVSWVPLVPDMRDEGIELVQKTAQHACPSRDLARHQLVYILLDYGHYDQALAIAEDLVARYPESIFMNWAYSHVKMKMRRYDEAIAAYEKILALVAAEKKPNPNHERTALIRMADMYARAGDCANARLFLQKTEEHFDGFSGANDDEVQQLSQRIRTMCAKP